jgi:hypothetical protein
LRARRPNDAALAREALENHETCPKWNYTVKPGSKKGK